MPRNSVIRSVVGFAVFLGVSAVTSGAMAQEFQLCISPANGNVKAIPAQQNCDDEPGNWIKLDFEDNDWTGAGSGELRTTNADDKVVVGSPSGTNAQLTVNAGSNEEAFRARANNKTALFVGADGQVGVREAQPDAALHIGANAQEAPLRVDKFGSNDPQLIVTSDGNVGVNVNPSTDKLRVLNTGDGRAGLFQNDNSGGVSAALSAVTNGRGSAVFANILRQDSTAPALHAIHTGGHLAGKFEGNVQVMGNVGINTQAPASFRLAVNGKIRAKEIIVETGWPDYVFDHDYELTPLPEVKAFIKANGRLPDVPSAAEVAANGISVGESQAALLRKIEELTLHVISLEERLAQIEGRSAQ